MRAFAISVLWGTVAAAWMPLFVTVLLACSLYFSSDGDFSLIGSLLLALSPLAFAFAFVLPACLLVGLPATALLHRLRLESLGIYLGIGLTAGFVFPLIVLTVINTLDSQQGWWMALLGAFSGLVTARTWWFEAREVVVG